MPKKSITKSTKRDKILRVERSRFIGRKDEIMYFRSLLPLERADDVDVLAFNGIGGIGKTTLLEEFRHLCRLSNVQVALVDVAVQQDVIAWLVKIFEDLHKVVPMSNFEEGRKRYERIRDKVASSEGGSDVARLVARSLLAGMMMIPIIGEPTAQLIGEEATHRAVSKVRSILTKEDADFFLEPGRTLLYQLLEDINNYAYDQRLVILIDTFEQIGPLEEWVRDFLLELAENVLVVIAGRYPLEGKNWQELGPIMLQRELGALSTQDADEYLHRLGIESPDVRAGLIAQANGYPLVLTMAAELATRQGSTDLTLLDSNDGQRIILNVIERLVGEIGDHDVEASLEMVAVRQGTTEDDLATLISTNTDKVFRKLRELSFIRETPFGLVLHKTARDAYLSDLKWRAPDRFNLLHQQAAEQYALRPSRRAVVERIYHTFQIDESRGLKLLEQAMDEAIALRDFSQASRLLGLVQTELPISEERQAWSTLYSSIISLEQHMGEDRVSEFKSALRLVYDNTSLSKRVRARAAKQLCDLLHIIVSAGFMSERPSEAVQSLLKSVLTLIQNEGADFDTIRASLLMVLGDTYRDRARIVDAKHNYKLAYDLAVQSGSSFLSAVAARKLDYMADISERLDEQTEYASIVLKIGRTLDNKMLIAQGIRGLAQPHIIRGENEDALLLLREAENLFDVVNDYRNLAGCREDMIFVLRELGDITTARRLLEAILENKRAHGSRFDLYFSLVCGSLIESVYDTVRAQNYLREAYDLRSKISVQRMHISTCIPIAEGNLLLRKQGAELAAIDTVAQNYIDGLLEALRSFNAWWLDRVYNHLQVSLRALNTLDARLLIPALIDTLISMWGAYLDEEVQARAEPYLAVQVQNRRITKELESLRYSLG